MEDTVAWLSEQIWKAFRAFGGDWCPRSLRVYFGLLRLPRPRADCPGNMAIPESMECQVDPAGLVQMKDRMLVSWNMRFAFPHKWEEIAAGFPQHTLVDQSQMCPQSCWPRWCNLKTSTFGYSGKMACLQNGNMGIIISHLILQPQH